MIIKLLFGLLVLTELALVLVGATFAALRPGLQPSQEADYRGEFTAEQYEGRHSLRVTLVVLAGGFSMFATVALLRRWRSAPVLFLASTGATMMIVEFLRPYVHPGAGEDYYESAIPLSAIVLVMIFFTPIRRWYRHLNGLAEPSAAPNGGPATRLDNSGVTAGPPSVS